MSPTETRAFVLNEPPVNDVVLELGKENSTFKLVNQTLDPLADGQVLVRTLIMSNDPTQRMWIQKGQDPERMYTAPVRPGDKMRTRAIAQVVESKSPDYNAGELVLSEMYWADYSILEASLIQRKVDNAVPLPLYISILGLIGMTAYFGLLEVAKAKKGDTVVVSAAAGATGSMVVQIAKAIGCRVIGISGGEEKCRYVESIGAEVCVDYKNANFKENIKKALGDKKFCEIYYDNVGGEILDVMLTLTKVHGTIVACGAISGYNDPTKLLVKNWGEIIVNRLTVKGFIVSDFRDQFADAANQIKAWIKDGKVKDDSYNLVDLSEKSKFGDIPKTWNLLFQNEKKPGKLLTKLADPE
jgi:NADPH-dependent curcumin reductase CurA